MTTAHSFNQVFFNDEFPNMAAGYGVSWIRVLDAVRALDADIFVPGHGSIPDDPKQTRAVPALNELAGAIASGWYGHPSDAMRVVGVTGTNGKTSCTQWIAAALGALGTPCALIGTLGSGMPGHLVHTGFTTPDAPQLQRSLAQLRRDGAQAVAMEV